MRKIGAVLIFSALLLCFTSCSNTNVQISKVDSTVENAVSNDSITDGVSDGGAENETVNDKSDIVTTSNDTKGVSDRGNEELQLSDIDEPVEFTLSDEVKNSETYKYLTTYDSMKQCDVVINYSDKQTIHIVKNNNDLYIEMVSGEAGVAVIAKDNKVYTLDKTNKQYMVTDEYEHILQQNPFVAIKNAFIMFDIGVADGKEYFVPKVNSGASLTSEDEKIYAEFDNSTGLKLKDSATGETMVIQIKGYSGDKVFDITGYKEVEEIGDSAE